MLRFDILLHPNRIPCAVAASRVEVMGNELDDQGLVFAGSQVRLSKTEPA